MIGSYLFIDLFVSVAADRFEYLRTGNCIDIDGVDDKKELQETVHALTLLGAYLHFHFHVQQFVNLAGT